MGLIRVSDSAENFVKEFAQKNNVTITNAVDTLLTQIDMAARMDKMAVYLDGKFKSLSDHIDSLASDIELSTISTPTRRTPKQAVNVPYEIFSDFFFDVLDLDDENPAWASKQACEEYHNSDCMDAFTYYFDGEFVYSEEGNSRFNWYKATPELTAYLQKKGVI